jgi:hypothetical protein
MTTRFGALPSDVHWPKTSEIPNTLKAPSLHLWTAGAPTQNDTTFCPLNQTSCYFWQTAGASFDDVSARCSARGGTLVSYAGAWVVAGWAF